MVRLFTLLNLDVNHLPKVLELYDFLRRMISPELIFRKSSILISLTLFSWMRYENYLIDWKDIIQHTDLSPAQFQKYLVGFHKHFPFECIAQDVKDIYIEYIVQAVLILRNKKMKRKIVR